MFFQHWLRSWSISWLTMLPVVVSPHPSFAAWSIA
ncbi:DUF2798 domain-containing protein [Cupriavidus consociatus]|nr:MULTISPECIES: DUF2798 domain-containing protein [unclassified Cupriavidus]MDK2659109.1 DUF2798 domain-containing protein [Cupriavidus sp. LEh21]